MLAEICNLVAYHEPKDGWVFATIEAIQNETTLSRKKQDAAIEVLQQFNLLEVTLRGMPARRHFKLPEKFTESVNNLLSSLSKTDKQVCPVGTMIIRIEV